MFTVCHNNDNIPAKTDPTNHLPPTHIRHIQHRPLLLLRNRPNSITNNPQHLQKRLRSHLPILRNNNNNLPSKASSRFNSKPNSPYLLHPTNNPFNHRNPYQLPIGVRSILRNSPLDHSTRRRSVSISAGGNGPNGAGSRRVFFPAKKQVSYRYPLEEEIRTERYTAQHIDLLSPTPSPSPEAVQHENDGPQTPPEPSCAHPDPEEETADSDSSPSSLPETSASGDDTSADEGIDPARPPALSKMERKKRRSVGIERQVRAVALLDGVEADGSSTPQTPRDHRVKRRREWRWTLGPINIPSDKDADGVSLLTLANSSSESLSRQSISESECGH
ncbi:hypothetical protein N7535_006616 [Penicillium sp. DV-2018c]|nr:hypothetical protein N7535_006616 [Penicillium sp. DV-2018c]